jgi:hypothetical protein
MYRSPSAGDAGAYFILSHEKQTDGTITVLSSRISKNDAYTDFTQLKVNCTSQQYFTLAGNGEDGKKQSLLSR